MKDGNVVVKAPISMRDDVINKFVEAKQDWIRQKLSLINRTNNKFEDIIHYKKFLLYANRYSLLLSDVKKIETNDNFQIVIPSKTEPDKILKLLKSWYKKIAKRIICDRVEFIQSRIKIKSALVRISDSKGKWGSCSSRKVVALNWRIVMLPPKLIDYVIVHELCHLVEMNHSKRFWALVERFLPNMSLLKKELKEYGFLLNLFNK